MAVSGIKPNKCFQRVAGIVFSGSDSVTVPANASAPRSITFANANIATDSIAIVTPQYDIGFQSGEISVQHCVTAGTLVVYVSNASSSDVTITVNVAVI